MISRNSGGASAAEFALILPVLMLMLFGTITPVIGNDVSMTISVDPALAAVVAYLPIIPGPLTTTVTMRKEPLAFGSGACGG